MKIRLIFPILAINLFASALLAQPLTDEAIKKTLHTMWIAHLAWNDNTVYWTPGNYIESTGSRQVIGQEFYTYGSYLYTRIEFKSVEGKPVEATSDAVKGATLTWQDRRLSHLKIGGLSSFDYNITYDKMGYPVEFLCNFSAKRQIIKKVFYDDAGQIAKISSYVNESGKLQLSGEKIFSHEGDTRVVRYINYKKNKPPKPKNIYSDLTGAYKRLSDNTFYVKQGWGAKDTLTYNEAGRIAVTKTESAQSSSTSTFVYFNDQPFRTERLTFKGGELTEKEIKIHFTRTDLPASLPSYEKEQGIYRFDSTGDMIWQAKGSKYQEKINGVWSPWQFFKM